MKMNRIYVVLACLAFLSASAVGQNANYDGKWWLSINQRQRVGFIDGFILCYAHFVDRKDPKIFHEGIPVYSARVKEYLQAHTESVPEPVEAILIKIASAAYAKTVHRPTSSNETSEQLAGNGAFTTTATRGVEPGPWNLGYVQGFLECYSKHSSHEYGTFSKTPEWYVNAIAHWYGTKGDDSDAINPTRQSEKIPEVLFRFRDPQTGK